MRNGTCSFFMAVQCLNFWEQQSDLPSSGLRTVVTAPTAPWLDLAKSIFHVHGVDAEGCERVRRKLRRGELLKFFAKLPPRLVCVEACASAHHWARQISALGHEVKLMPPAYVKLYVRRQKNDMADAAAICEAVSRPSMRTSRSRARASKQRFLPIAGVRF
jgi:transposase